MLKYFAFNKWHLVLLSAFWSLIFSGPLFLYSASDTLPSSDNLRISILTCSAGQEIYSMYGHSAIRIQDKTEGHDWVFNYGTFDFNTPNFTLKFMKGQLPYALSVTTYENFMYEYRATNRSVIAYPLALDNTQTSAIYEALLTNMSPENRFYAYDFFYDNCATRILDILENVVMVDTNILQQSAQMSFRDGIKKYHSTWKWTDFGIDLIIGKGADCTMTQRQSTFLPYYLTEIVHRLTYGDQISPIVVEEPYVLFSSSSSHETNTSLMQIWRPEMVFGFLFVLEVLAWLLLKIEKLSQTYLKWYDLTWLGIITIGNVLLIFMWWGTDHLATKDNFNLLWMSPIPIVAIILAGNSPRMATFVWMIYGALVAISILTAAQIITWIPQYFHPAVVWIGLIILIKIFRQIQRIKNL